MCCVASRITRVYKSRLVQAENFAECPHNYADTGEEDHSRVESDVAGDR